jgi:formylglycine-generating enzyme required for sulfatase activity
MFIAATMGSVQHGFGQNQPPLHPDYNIKYFYTHKEPAQKGIFLEPNHKLIKSLSEKYLQIGNSDSFPVSIDQQWGYDTIRTVPDEFFVSAFLMQKTEVTNEEYSLFLKDVSSPFFKDKGLTLSWLTPDTTVWTNPVSYMEPYTYYYLRHPAYGTYPVVGVSQYQATTYCDWLEKKLNEQYAKIIPHGYKILVDLPTSAEFFASARFTIFPLNQNKIDKLKYFTWSLDYALGWGQSELNYGSLKNNRLMEIKPLNYLPGVVSTKKECSTPLAHLFGNAAEWTSTRATEKLKNNKNWIITTTGKIMKNPDVTVHEEDLVTYLHKPEDLNNHFVVKGGSWNEEFHFMDPAVVQMKRGDYKSANIGFRTVIRIKKI